MRSRHTGFAAIAVLALIVTACGDDAAPSTAATTASTAAASTDESLEDSIEDMVEDLEDQQAAVGGGGATLTVGDNTWTFDSVLCAFGPEQIGQEDAVFVLSAIKDGLQLYVSVDGFGDSVSIDDISDFENPSVSLSAFDAEQGSFVAIDGKSVSAQAEFLDSLSDDFASYPGTLQATCP